MADTKGREASNQPPAEGDPHDVERSVKDELAERGIEPGNEDFDALTGEHPPTGPTAGGG